MTGNISLSQSIVRAVCERDDYPDPSHDDTLLIAAGDLETIIENHFEHWAQTAFNMSLKDFQSREEAARIADAVLGWLVKHDLADAGNEYRAADVIAIMDDLAPSHLPKMALQNDGAAIPDLPEKVWIDPRDLSIHYTEGSGRLAFVSAPDPKRPKHHKSDADIARIRELADQGLTQKQIANRLNMHPRTIRKFAGRVYGQHQAAFTPAEIADILEKANG